MSLPSSRPRSGHAGGTSSSSPPYAFAGLAFGFAIAVAIAIGCETVRPADADDAAYPCGVWGVECRKKTCCPWAHICGDSEGYGFFNRCPDGYCCADVDPHYGAPVRSIETDAGQADAGPRQSIVRARPPR